MKKWSKIHKLTDEELISSLLSSGNSLYYEQLYNRYFQKVFYQALSYLKDEEEARDVTQDIFVKLYDRLAKFKEQSRFSTWLFIFARNTVLDYLRIKGRLPQENVEVSEIESVREVSDNELFQIRSERLAFLLNQISPEEKSLLIMKYAHDWQMDEIAEYLEISLSAVKMRLKRARQKVKELHDNLYENN